ncbi:probable ATP-dependent RNA helicase CG8611 [Euwallacea fornicatus]|uniref:probable ATP-dependent RNA helicase CG8611 n=1 Tax=Euwallacea fornicatus TaxID=995702 RepID=UPI00338E3958
MTSFEFKFTKSKSKSNKLREHKGLPLRKSNAGKQIKSQAPSSNINLLENLTFPKNKEKLKLDSALVRRKQKKEQIKSFEAPTEVVDNDFSSSGGKKSRSLFSEKYKTLHVNANVRGASVTEKVFSVDRKFSELNIHQHLKSNLQKNGFAILTNVQDKAIPIVLSGENCLIRSQTGSGKTLTYIVPILNKLINIAPKLQRSDGIQAIIVVPTRELALQTHELFTKLNSFQWIIGSHLCGGENRKTEKEKLRRGVHVLIGTPGRLLDHMLHTAAFNGKNVQCLVLDEADKLLDMGFKKDIVRLVEELERLKFNSSYDPLALLKNREIHPVDNQQSSVKSTRQTLLLSATLSKSIAELADFTMKDHVYIDALDKSTNINPEHMIIPNTVKQQFLLTFIKHRLVMLSAFLVHQAKQNSKTIVFMATSQMVEFHYELFNKCLLKMPVNRGKMTIGDVLLLEGVELDDSDDEEKALDIELFKLHGNMSQQERKTVFNGFRKIKKGILICTDVAARGIDVPEADCIVQYTGPQSDDDYLHRVGRTGRAGKSGSAVIFLTHEEQDYISRLQEHKVFVRECDTAPLIRTFIDFMDEPDQEKATLSLQRRYEAAIAKNKSLHSKACLAYTSWSRFYSAFPQKMRTIFDLKKINVGHYVTSFGLEESPTAVARIAKGQAAKVEPRNLNRKLANHEDNQELVKPRKKRSLKSLSLTASEFSSGLEPAKKKKKNNQTS